MEIRGLRTESLRKMNWGSAFLFVLVLGIVLFLIFLVSAFIPFIGPFISSILIIPVISAGIYLYGLNVSRETDPRIGDMFAGFNDYGRVLGAVLFKTLLTILWSIPLFVSIFKFFGSMIQHNFVSIEAFLDNAATIFYERAYDVSWEPVLSDFGVTIEFGTNSIIWLILIVVSAIFLAIMAMRYTFVEFIAFDDPAVSPVKESVRLMKGRKFKLFMLYLPIVIIVAIIQNIVRLTAGVPILGLLLSLVHLFFSMGLSVYYVVLAAGFYDAALEDDGFTSPKVTTTETSDLDW